MTIKYGAAYRGTLSAPLNTALGTAAIAKLFAGTIPADCAAADSAGPLLATWNWIVTWGAVNTPANGQISAVAPNVPGATAPGPGGAATHFRIYNATGPVCVIQGSAGTTATDWILTNVNISTGQIVTFNSMIITFYGA